MSIPEDRYTANLAARHRMGKIFEICCLLCTFVGLVVLVILLGSIIWMSAGWLNWGFLTSFDSYRPEQAGIKAALWGSLWVILFTVFFSVPLGVGAAVYLEEYASTNWFTTFIRINISNLAGVPSIVYGILGLTVFVRMFGLFGRGKEVELMLGFGTLTIPLPFGRTVISASLTLSLLILPVVIIASQEALRAVPPSLRHASYALGATHWQTIRHQVLPAAFPGVLTGVILAISRAMGETAPLIMIGALTYVAFTPGDISSPMDMLRNPEAAINAPFDGFTSLPILVFNWVTRSKVEYQHLAAAGILVLLTLLLLLNGTAVFLRHRYQTKIRW